MDDKKTTQISLNEDSPTGVTSKVHGANIDALAFNISFIMTKNPTLAVELMKLYEQAHAISPDDPPYPDEDFELAYDNLPNNPFKS